MKRCPECRRDYFDETLSFCLDDGTRLVHGPAGDDPATAILNSVPTSDGARPLGNTTDRTSILSRTDAGNKAPSSPEHRLTEARKSKRGIAVLLAVGILAAAGSAYWFFARNAATAPVRSIAVLPFQNRGGDADTDYLSDGIAESLIFRLSQLPDLKVSPTSSVMRYKGNETDIAAIAKELDVDAVMSGRLAQRGDALTISVELVDARTKKLLWGEQYDRKMADLLATQREIASSIVQKLELKLAGSDAKGVTKRYTDSSEAYQLYLKGRFLFAKRTEDGLKQAIELYRQAIALDPRFALAYVGIGECYAVMPSYPYMSPREAAPQAKAAIEKALELDPDLPEAHTVSGMIAATYDWDWKRAESEFKRSLEIDPNLAITHYRYAWTFLSAMGRHDEAVAEMKRAMELEPLSIPQGANFAGVYMYARRFDEAVDQAKKTYDLDPNGVTPKNWICHTLNANGRYADSLAFSEPTLQSAANPLIASAGFSYAKLGRRADAQHIVDRYVEAEKTKYVMNYWVAIVYAAMGEKDKAFAELEKAYAAHDWFMQRIKVDPFMDPLRGDPRFDDLVKRMGLNS